MRQIKLSENEVDKVLNKMKDMLLKGKSVKSKLDFSFELPNIKNEKKAKIIFTEVAYMKMQLLISEFSTEVAWSGIVERIDDYTFKVTDIIIFPQEVTGVTVNTDEVKLKAWEDKIPDDVFNKMRMHGHSHVNMGTTPSKTDDDLQESYVKQLPADDYYIYLICNKKGEVWSCIYDLKCNCVYEKNDIDLTYEVSDWRSAFEKEMKDMVVKKNPVQVNTYHSNLYRGSPHNAQTNQQTRWGDWNV